MISRKKKVELRFHKHEEYIETMRTKENGQIEKPLEFFYESKRKIESTLAKDQTGLLEPN